MNKSSLSSSKIRRFRSIVRTYMKKHGRTLPWRSGYDPYPIFISEVMLQQTQVDRVALKFPLFISAFPDFQALADAPLANVLSHWQGLGYNRRALNLKKAAEIIVLEYGGILPDSPERLVRLPGIGTATAASICAFAFNKPVAFLETNIRTVLIHHFFPDQSVVTDQELLPVAELVLDRKNPREWYSALMDYGTMLKKRHGNVTRRSAHYKTQSRFKGSIRQVRGAILKALLARPSLTLDQLAALIPTPPDTLRLVTKHLVREKLLVLGKNRYRIP
jgi:A/G-specific adenine glycosylase